jgi:hypothetical protein
MDTIQTQQVFFNLIRSKLPPYLSLAEEIAMQLDISSDSAYRRIRGEKQLSLDEVKTLCNAYTISIDQLFGLKAGTYMFSGNLVDSLTFGFEKYLQDIIGALEKFKTIPDSHIYFYNKDIPVFHHMQFPELSSFKFFFWKRTLMGYSDLAKQQFTEEQVDREASVLGARIIALYNQIPSTEIWNEENVHSTIRQIEFYRQSNVFAERSTVVKLYTQLQELLDHIEHQAEIGRKFMHDKLPQSSSASYDIYINECLIGDNTIFVKGAEHQITNLNHNGLNFITSMDKNFCDYTFKNLQNIIRKSTHISQAGEKERSMFFNALRDKINERKKSL